MEPGQGVRSLCRIAHRIGAIAVIVVGGVRTKTHAQRLDQRWPPSGKGDFACFARGMIHGNGVQPIHLYATHRVTGSTRDHTTGGNLILFRHANGVVIVLAKENYRQFVDAGDACRLVKIALGGCALTEIRDAHALLPKHARGIGTADRMGDLRGN